jgi:hypothetical protein
MMDVAKSQTIRLAHYSAGLNGSSWRTEHKRICPKLSDDTRDGWNVLVAGSERRDCQRVGSLVRRRAPLTLEDAAIQAHAVQFEAADLRGLVRIRPTGEI